MRGERQKEVTDAFRNNFDKIFGKPKVTHSKTCEYCGSDEDVYTCKKCGVHFCINHESPDSWDTIKCPECDEHVTIPK